MIIKKRLVVFLCLSISFSAIFAQEELNAVVIVNANRVQSTNKQVFNTLQQSLTEFINQTRWTNKKFLTQERINCAFTIIINEQNSNNFIATLQVQSSRPVYNSSYETPLLNINDSNLNFKYNEFEPLIYNPNIFDSNLVSTIVFYVYIILGIDADTFALRGGETYFKQAENTMLQAQQSGETGWENKIGKQNRFALIDNLLSFKFEVLRTIYYEYHRKGLDIFANDERKAKQTIINSLLQLDKLFNITVGNYMIRIFLDAKAEEIRELFSQGKPVGTEEKLKELLQKIAPLQNNKWKKI